MSDYIDTRDGWREGTSSEYMRERHLGNPTLISEVGVPLSTEMRKVYWVREKPVPPLPTEPHTMILARSRYDGSEREYLLRMTGKWLDLSMNDRFTAEQVAERITGFEVLARPVGKVLAEDEDTYYDSDDVRGIKEAVRRDTAKAVLDRVYDRVLGQTSWSRTGMHEIAREFGVKA